MNDGVYPLLFAPVYKDYLWGGNKLASRYGRSGTPAICAESWEVSDRPEGMSIVTNGAQKGRALHELVQTWGPALTGADDDTFPLLIKLIDARRDLSVQVHPNDANAHLTGGDPKTEMWYVLEAEPKAQIYAGLRPGCTRQQFEQALHKGTLETDALAAIPAKPGRAIFVPGGRVHAIGAGCLLLEIQQNSNTTYRVYDWNRTDNQGRSRELHLEQAMNVIDWNNSQPEVCSPRPRVTDGDNSIADIIDCPFFTSERLVLNTAESVAHDGKTFHIIFLVSGNLLIGAEGQVASAEQATSCLIPAAARHYTLTPINGPATVIRITRTPAAS
jgi:mannose-6-phosphate isomerase